MRRSAESLERDMAALLEEYGCRTDEIDALRIERDWLRGEVARLSGIIRLAAMAADAGKAA